MRDLNTHKHVKRPYRQAAPRPDDQQGTVNDLLYDGPEQFEELKSIFDGAILEGSYDYIKGERTSVTIPHCSQRRWYTYLLRHGMSGISLCFQVSMYKDMELIKSILDEIDPGWQTRSKKRRA